MNPTRTTNKVHFEDLDPLRFEDLAVNLLMRKINYTKVLHHGRMGNDSGVDICVMEKLPGKRQERLICAQCKRYKRFSKKDAKQVFDKLISSNKQYSKIIFIVSCSISKATTDYIETLAKIQGFEWEVWSDTVLEAMLYFEFPDLLKLYFGTISKSEEEKRIAQIERRKQLRDIFEANLLVPFDPAQSLSGPHRFKYRKFLIYSLDYENGENVANEFGWFKYFAVRPYSINDKGIYVLTDFKKVYKDQEGALHQEIIENSWEEKIIYRAALLSYDNISSYDLNSDQGRPIFYSMYFGENGPFSDIRWIEDI